MNRKQKMAVRGVCLAEITAACPESLLNACAMDGLELWDMVSKDSVSLSFCFFEKDLPRLSLLAEKCMCSLKTETVRGGSRLAGFIKRHMALVLSLLIALALLCLSSLFVWDMEVHGNVGLSEGEVLRALSHCGVDRGCYIPGIDRELLRNRMLIELPELAWMTVNLRGSRAQVLVAERQEKPEIYMESRYADLIASKSAVVREIYARNGKVLVTEGSAVLQGETLISAAMDSITARPRYVRSQGEVIGETWYELCAVSPEKVPLKTEKKAPRLRFAVKIGKKRFNFYFGERKTVDGYDKIIDNYIIGLEDVFTLPLSIVVERFIPYATEPGAGEDAASLAARLSDTLEDRVDGEILSSGVVESTGKGLNIVTLRAACLENIARLREYSRIEDKMP